MNSSEYILLLHAHLPYVRHPEHEDFLEEDWFYEALLDCYLPLLDVFQSLREEEVRFRLAMTLSPTLCEMLADPLLCVRFERWLDRRIQQVVSDSRPQVRYLHDRWVKLKESWKETWNRNVVGAFKSFHDSGHVELLACPATHGFLPFLKDQEQLVRAQLGIGRQQFREHFGCWPQGVWLPECAYDPCLEPLIRNAGFEWFVVEGSAVATGVRQPVLRSQNLVAWPRDAGACARIWDAKRGYPAHADYRDFYADEGREAAGRFSGFKCTSVSGDVYDPVQAKRVAAAHATAFASACQADLAEGGVQLCAFDCELFGHWWHEGPAFLEAFLRNPEGLSLTTPSASQAIPFTSDIRVSSWGEQKDFHVWMNPANQWIYPHLESHGAFMIRAASQLRGTLSTLQKRMLQQMTRELLLAQSSDWAFLMHGDAAATYAESRIRSHLERFQALRALWESGREDPAFLADCEERDAVFKNPDFSFYQSPV